MRLFQNSGVGRTYGHRLNRLAADATTFRQRLDVFLDDRFGASHFLEPVLNRDASAFFTNADDLRLQRMWAAEAGMPAGSSPAQILLMQIEQHRTEVFYNLDPMRFQSDFVRKLPGCVKHSVAWRAAPSPGADFEAYDLVVCNFPGILAGYAHNGWRAKYFSPAHDPVLDEYAGNRERPVDVLFVGGFSRHHKQRARLLETVAARVDTLSVVMHLDESRLARLAASPFGRLLPLGQHRVPAAVGKVSRSSVYGRDMYAALSRAKIVLNAAIDMSGPDRGNMRCFESLGAGCLLLTDDGRYPPGMLDGETLVIFKNPDEAIWRLSELVRDSALRERISQAGNRMIRANYSKTQQFRAFTELVG
jgi:glycosyltransferase involved in cell wall biosynthesis